MSAQQDIHRSGEERAQTTQILFLLRAGDRRPKYHPEICRGAHQKACIHVRQS